MNPLQIITLVLMLVILSITGLWAEEMMLTDASKGTFEQVEQIRTLAGIVGTLSNDADDSRSALKRLRKEGDKFYYADNYPAALEKFKEGLKRARKLGDKEYISMFLSDIGIVYHNQAKYQKALEYHEEALTIAREIGDRRGEGSNLTNIGVVHNNLGQYQPALNNYQQALEIKRKIGDKRGESTDLVNIGVVHNNLGQYQTALNYYQPALEIKREIGDRRGEGSVLSNIGVVQDNLGQYQTTLSTRSEIGDRRGKSSNLTNIGVYDNSGQYQTTLDNYQQPLSIRHEIGDKRREGSEGFNLTNIGVKYDNFQIVSDNYQQPLSIKREIGTRRGEGDDLGNISVEYRSFGQCQTALECFQQALSIRRDIGDRRGEGDDLGNLGNMSQDLGQYQTALEYYQKALAIHKNIGDRHGEASDLTNIGVVYQNLGNYQKAKEAFQDSLVIKENIGADNTWTSQRGLASVAAKLKQSESAIQYYEQALNNIEKLRAGLVEKTHKTSFMRSKLYVYDELITLLQSLHLTQPQQGYDRKALEIFERKQGRVFLEEMGKSGAWRFAGVQEKISRKDRELEQQIATTRQKRTEALEQGKDAEQHSKRLTKLIADQQAFEKMLATDYPKYYQLKYPKPASLVTLQQKVLQIGEMMLVYNVMKESTALWVIGKQQFQMFTLPVGGKTLSESVYGEEGLRKLIKERLLEFTEVSHVLYQTLLPKAVRQLIAKADTLYIVPTSILYGLPFEALVTAIADDDIPHYLIQDYAIVYLSSASLLKTLRDERRKKAPQPLLAFANPDYPPCSDGKSKEKRTGKIVANRIVELCPKERNVQKTRNECLLPPLVETEDEVCQIATLFNIPKQAFEKVLYLRKAATRQNLLKLNENGELDNYRYLMFSVHGFLPNEIEFIPQPALAFSMSDVADETGYLTMADAFTLELNADFVNLSACNTGRGTHIQGEGFMSLNRAFMYAGTPAVAVGLWKADMKPTKDLNINLFKNLKAGKKIAKALQQAKVTMIEGKASHPEYNDPFHWAPFVLYGDGN